MEVYILDDLLRRETVIDRFESLIWTERYSAFGDFSLVIYSTAQTRALLVEDTWLAINNSRRVMMIENVENKTDSEGRQLLTISGRSLEAILEDRAVRQNMNGTQTDPNWTLSPNPPATALRGLFDYICRIGALTPADIIPSLVGGSLYPPNTISEPDTVVTIVADPKDLYTFLKEQSEIYGLGFRLYRGPDDSKLYFDIYTGDDRTSAQTTLPAVIFAPDLENLTNTSEFRSIEKYKNICLVVGKSRSRWVYKDTDAAVATGRDRRIVIIQVSDIDFDTYVVTDPMKAAVAAAKTISTMSATEKTGLDQVIANIDISSALETSLKAYQTNAALTAQQKTDYTSLFTLYDNYRVIRPTLDAVLEQRGQEELTKYKPLKAMDGELPNNSKYRYGTDYELGDLVEMRNEDGLTNRMRVTEQIFVDDAQGERSYPTLALDEFITPGTWFAWDANGVWDTAPGVWAFAGGEVGNDNLLPNGNLEDGTTNGWAGYASSTLTPSSISTDMHSGNYGLKIVTTDVNGGAAAPLAALAATPIGAYAGSIWLETTFNHTFKAKIQEFTVGGSLIGESSVVTGPAAGNWQQCTFTYTKQQPDTVLRISVQKDTAGTIYLDDAELRMIL